MLVSVEDKVKTVLPQRLPHQSEVNKRLKRFALLPRGNWEELVMKNRNPKPGVVDAIPWKALCLKVVTNRLDLHPRDARHIVSS
jgi:hypothetical protein